jgi:uncharacterized membrane protein
VGGSQKPVVLKDIAMKEWLALATEYTTVIIDIFALVLVIIGTLEAFVGGLRVMLFGQQGHERRDVWLRYARWLVAALTFQLAADIVESSITTDWNAVGRLAAIAVVRTFLNYFLERDLVEVRERQHETERLPLG